MPDPNMVPVSLRMPPVMRDELAAIAREISETTGRKVTRSDVERGFLADGIRRAHTARRYVARYAPKEPT